MNMLNNNVPAVSQMVMLAAGGAGCDPDLMDAIDVTEDAEGHRAYIGFAGSIFITAEAYALMVAWSDSDSQRTGLYNDTETRLDALFAQCAAAVRAVRAGDTSAQALIEYDDASKRGNPRRARLQVKAVYGGLLFDLV